MTHIKRPYIDHEGIGHLICKTEGCERRASIRGYCKLCYNKERPNITPIRNIKPVVYPKRHDYGL